MTDKHPSHVTRFSDSSFYDEICVNCGAHDNAPGGWGDLARECPGTSPDLTCEDFGLDACGSDGKAYAVYSPAFLKYGSPNLWGRFCSLHHALVSKAPQMEWTNAMISHWRRRLERGLSI